MGISMGKAKKYAYEVDYGNGKFQYEEFTGTIEEYDIHLQTITEMYPYSVIYPIQKFRYKCENDRDQNEYEGFYTGTEKGFLEYQKKTQELWGYYYWGIKIEDLSEEEIETYKEIYHS